MGKTLEGGLTPAVAAFIASQRVFFVATAPLSAAHHVNVSPKTNGGSSLAVLDAHTLAFADLSGSGAETAAHVLQNGRVTFMFANLEAGAPQILRVFGEASLLLPGEAPPALLARFGEATSRSPGLRAIFVTRVHRVSHSCGYSMPVLRFERQRTVLDEFVEKIERPAAEGGGYVVRGGFADGRRLSSMGEYRALKNAFSIDGLPSLAMAVPGAAPVKPVLTAGFNQAAPLSPSDGAVAAAAAAAHSVAVAGSAARRPVALPQLSQPPSPPRPPPAAGKGGGSSGAAANAAAAATAQQQQHAALRAAMESLTLAQTASSANVAVNANMATKLDELRQLLQQQQQQQQQQQHRAGWALAAGLGLGVGFLCGWASAKRNTQ